jgi:hypothetical protein
MDQTQLTNYNDILRQIISEIKSTRVVVARRVNTEMMQLYWNIGKRLAFEGLEKKGTEAAWLNNWPTICNKNFPTQPGFRPGIFGI